MWLAELHVAPDRSVCAAPLTIASAIAARTKNMKIGTGVQVLPLCHPLRIAEEAATVDQISLGRLIFGVGRSGFPRTYEAYGVPYGESRERFAETLEILKRAWTEPSFSYHGKYYSFENVRLAPQPYRRQQLRYLPEHRQARAWGAGCSPTGHAGGAGTEYLRLPQCVEGGGPPRPGQGLPARSGLCRRHRSGGARRAGREHHVLLPLSRRAARGLGNPPGRTAR